ncbi:MAG: hypothetical protein O4805_21095 [Trichodesmium sp. St16_bin2-tuft]|nr:hypothetical protein [Trichodesmium sp. MAG_R02]MDE5089482.1 hypothetical protein [Trichodesmium sp. St16_bin2-tuft]
MCYHSCLTFPLWLGLGFVTVCYIPCSSVGRFYGTSLQGFGCEDVVY